MGEIAGTHLSELWFGWVFQDIPSNFLQRLDRYQKVGRVLMLVIQ
jgi:hypothetical protein